MNISKIWIETRMLLCIRKCDSRAIVYTGEDNPRKEDKVYDDNSFYLFLEQTSLV